MAEASVAAIEAFLDGKPQRSGKLSAADKQSGFWSCAFIRGLPAEIWTAEPMVLALAHYMRQERYANPALITHVASIAPEAVRRAARYSGLVLRQHSPRWREIAELADSHADEFNEFIRIFDVFEDARLSRATALEQRKSPLGGLTPLELLAYASLYAFDHLVPPALGLIPKTHDAIEMQDAWDAINDLLKWKLANCDPSSLQLGEADIVDSMRRHLTPFLVPSRDQAPPREDLYRAFAQLMDAMIEWNSFVARSAEAFSYDDGIRFVREGARLEIVERDAQARAAWGRDGNKLTRLQGYWLYRGRDALLASEATLARVGRKNFDANLQAFAKAMATQLRLTEVYGVADTVQAESGLRVELFHALLALELMTAFFLKDFIRPYIDYLQQCGNARTALGRLAFDGMLRGENRWPLTWSDKAAKIARIRSWTVSSEFPQGNAKAAEAILDFWTSDWLALSDRLRNGEPGLQPELFERPMLKMGRTLFQLPWVVALQNNATGAINNLRRIGARLAGAREDTRRIEHRLGEQFAERNFRVQTNCQPAALDGNDPGEVDLVCARDDYVLVLEIKSTFLRRSQKDAWLHGSSTLRKAGLQLQRKVRAVSRALADDADFAKDLGMSPTRGMPFVVGWIVDTSIECDHQRFCGFLKISLEEVLIALRDDRRLLNDPDGLLGLTSGRPRQSSDAAWTLYEDAFSAARFVHVIEHGAVWDERPIHVEGAQQCN